MNSPILDFLRDPRTRQLGRTTALAEASLRVGATFVVSSQVIAKDLKRQFPKLKCVAYTNPDNLRGIGKIIFDHHVIEQAYGETEGKLYNLNSKLIDKSHEAKSLGAIVVQARQRIEQLDSTIWELNQKLRTVTKHAARESSVLAVVIAILAAAHIFRPF